VAALAHLATAHELPTEPIVALWRHSRTVAQANALIADSGTGARDLVGVILRERSAVVSTLEQA
jgi:hypothetical protein